MRSVTDLQVTASCTAARGDDASLDGSVVITVDGTTAAHEGLADGTAEFSMTGADASFLIIADVKCDTAEPGVTYEAVGVGAAQFPSGDAVSGVDAAAAGYSAYSLPATGLDGSGLSAFALAAVVAGTALVRIARRVVA